MQLTLQLKRLGKKKVKKVPFTLAETPQTLEDLLIACVKNQVAAFNNKRLAVNVIGFLTPFLLTVSSILDPTGPLINLTDSIKDLP